MKTRPVKIKKQKQNRNELVEMLENKMIEDENRSMTTKELWHYRERGILLNYLCLERR